ncbi:MAG TPA: acyl carrier protein [Steroidobacteraceae bacterium]|nr:acyl carrier protein [Steroidobacteraceae bacterium]
MHDSLLPRLQRAFQRALGVEPGAVGLDTEPDDIPQWDSLGHATLACALEREFNVSFDTDELLELESVRAILRVLHRKLG